MENEVKNYEKFERGKKYEVGTILVPQSVLLVVAPTINGCYGCYFLEEHSCDGIDCNGIIYKRIN